MACAAGSKGNSEAAERVRRFLHSERCRSFSFFFRLVIYRWSAIDISMKRADGNIQFHLQFHQTNIEHISTKRLQN